MSPSELLDAAKVEVATINLATVYRALNRLIDKGTIAAVNLPGEPPRYEMASAAAHHHHHFRCDQCDKVYDIPGCAHGVAADLPDGFLERMHEVVIFGVCKECGSGDGSKKKSRKKPASTRGHSHDHDHLHKHSHGHSH